ncbi:hypothetical protein NECAME_09900 [Necator americanus]|uniref:Uncharacterized protein n=1 Tax=Necator americanus TaxID=51031 RepID=W2TCK7_NECAM|nr:hypothetical protein NECAME_09900 [Necator americanus]ETN79324.1 hypothetical protein NECAME_09900 [Necator americanus]
MLAWLSFVLLCSLISARELRYAGTSTLRDVRAIAPSYSSWCIFYPERCRLLNTAQGIAGYHESSGYLLKVAMGGIPLAKKYGHLRRLIRLQMMMMVVTKPNLFFLGEH